MEKEIILGIDPGTKVTGYGVILKEKGNIIPLDFGCIRPPYKLDLHSRYLIIFESLEEIIKKYNPTSVAIETQFVQKNVQSALKLGMARACAILAAKRNNLSLFEYAPKKAKLSVVGVGSASKEQVSKMVKMILNIQDVKIPEDATDALSIAICHSHQRRF